jgi:hypothetical protein
VKEGRKQGSEMVRLAIFGSNASPEVFIQAIYLIIFCDRDKQK